MTPGSLDAGPGMVPKAGVDLHALVAARDPTIRYAVAALLVDAGLRVTAAATFGVVEILLETSALFDVMVTAQSAEEITQFGVPQLARSMQADLPILVLEFDTALAPTVVDLVHEALNRWPLRQRSDVALH